MKGISIRYRVHVMGYEHILRYYGIALRVQGKSLGV
jgi:hypothetical protein